MLPSPSVRLLHPHAPPRPPQLTAHYPELLGNVFVAPVNALFYAVRAAARRAGRPEGGRDGRE